MLCLTPSLFVSFLLTSLQEVVVKKDETLPFTESSLKEANDLISLDELNEAVILHNLRARYSRDIIYVRSTF